MSEQTNNNLAIEAKGLVKVYEGDVLAVDGIDMAIEANTIYNPTTTMNTHTTPFQQIQYF